MSLTLKRKQIVFAGLIVSLAAAIYVNWYYTRPVDMTEIQTESTTQAQQVNLGDAQFVNATLDENYFASAQLKRSQAQDEAKQSLQAMRVDTHTCVPIRMCFVEPMEEALYSANRYAYRRIDTHVPIRIKRTNTYLHISFNLTLTYRYA